MIILILVLVSLGHVRQYPPAIPPSPNEPLRASLISRIAKKDYKYVYGLAEVTMDRLSSEPIAKDNTGLHEPGVRYDLGYLFGRAALNLGKYREAMDAFRWAAKYRPEEPPVYVPIYDQLRSLKSVPVSFAAAQSWKLRARVMSPESAGKYYPNSATKDGIKAELNLVGAYQAMHDGDYDVEGVYVEAAQDALPHNVFITEWLARIRRMQKRWQSSWNLWIEAYNLADDQERATMSYDMNRFVADLHANHILVRGDIPLQRVGHK